MSEILNFIKKLAIGTNEATRFAESADVVIEHYNSVLKEDLSNSPTFYDIERYYTYYTAYTKLTAVLEKSDGWSTKDIFPIDFHEYSGKAAEIGWAFLRQSVGIESKGWEDPNPCSCDGNTYSEYDEEYDEEEHSGTGW